MYFKISFFIIFVRCLASLIFFHTLYMHGIRNKLKFFSVGVGGEVGQSVRIYLFQPPRLPSRYLCSVKTSCLAPVPVYPAVWPSTLASTLYVSCSQPRTQRHCLAWTGSSRELAMWVAPSTGRLIGSLAKFMRFCWQCFRVLTQVSSAKASQWKYMLFGKNRQP